MRLTQEHKELQRTIERFVENEINPHVATWEKEQMFPAHALFKKMGDLGLLGLTKPEEFGGMGLDYSYSVVAAQALGKIHCGVLGIFRPKTTKCSGGLSGRGLQRGITFP